MKSLFFTLVTTGLVSLSSFTTTPEIESLEDSNTVPCRWRSERIIDGVLWATEWTYGNCNQTESGKLIPIR